VDAAHRITRNPVTEVLQYLKAKAAFARKYIARAAADLPPPGAILANIRRVRAKLVNRIANIRSAWVETELTLGSLLLAERPSAVGVKAYDDRIENVRKNVKENEKKIAPAEQALA